MPTMTPEELDRKLQENGFNTLEQICQRVREVIDRRSPHSNLPKELDAWAAGGYDPSFLQDHIRPSLVSLRRTLAQKQYRCDGDLEQLAAVERAMSDGSAKQHVLDTIYARVFVMWCDHFIEITREEVAVS